MNEENTKNDIDMDETRDAPLTPEQEAEVVFRQSAESEWWELFKTVFWAVLIALLFRTFLFQPFNIPSGSMKPNLLVGDYLFVSKFSYGYSRFSLPFGLPFIQGRVMADAPQRGDVAVFKLPSNNATDYIKRVVGLPGDTIQMIDGRLYINGEMLPRELVDVVIDRDNTGNDVRMHVYNETLPGGIEHIIYEEDDNGPLDNTREYVVPEGHYFMMGDNRDNSQDSRVETMVGYVPLVNFVGRAERIFFSTRGDAQLWEFWRWPQTIRFSRLLQEVH